MKKLFGLLLASCLCVNAHAASYYFDHVSGSDSTGTGTIGNPYKTFKGTTLDNTSALSCGDTINLKRGSSQIWEGSEAEIVIDSGTSSCSSNPIYVQSYGTGALPILAGAAVTSAGWSVASSTTYQISGQTQTYLKTVTQDDNKALFYADAPAWATTPGSYYGATVWSSGQSYSSTVNATGNFVVNGGVYYQCLVSHTSGTFATDLAAGKWVAHRLPEGSFRREGSTLYVHLWNDANPATSNVRIGSFSHSSSADGARGLLSGSRNSTRGHYIYFRDIVVLGSNGVGFSVSGAGNRSANLSIIGAGADGLLCYSELTGSAESCTSYRDYYSTVTYSAAGANGGGGYGQGVTNYGGPYNFWIGTTAHHNAMAGFDALNIGSNGTSIQGGFVRTKSYSNGQHVSEPSFDANYYCDGCSQWLFMGIEGYGGGKGKAGANNARPVLSIGAEYPTTRPAHDVDVISANLYGTNYLGFNIANATTSGYATNKNIKIYYSTISTDLTTSYDSSYFIEPTEIDTTASNIELKGNIFIYDASHFANDYMTTMTAISSDYNVHYRRATASSSTPIYSTDGGSTTYSRAAWNTLTGNESHGAYGNPVLTSDADSSNDVHLGVASAATDACAGLTYSPPSWLPSDIFPTSASKNIRGYSSSTTTLDDVNSSPDCGFHYMYGLVTSPSVTPASLVASAVGSSTVTFTLPDSVIFYTGKIKVTFPSGFTLSSGGTSTVTLVSGITGTVSSNVSGQAITITRTGDGNTEFPGTFSFTISNIANPSSTGTTGTFKIQTYDASDNLIAEETAVSAVTISASGGGGGGGTPAVTPNSGVVMGA